MSKTLTERKMSARFELSPMRGMEAEEVMSKEDTKAALKEALKEWMDEKFAAFGRWSFYAIAAMGLTALVYFMLRMNGWKQ